VSEAIIPDGAVLTRRQLNRTLLARQLLLARSPMTANDALEHLVGMQSQNPNDPYVALWTRLYGFHTDHLSDMMRDRSAVRASLMRGTIHLVTARDYLRLFPVTYPLHERVFPGIDAGRRLPPEVIPDVVAAGHELLHGSPMTLKELGAKLATRWPELHPASMAQACRFQLPLVQVTPRGIWGASHQATWTLADDWLGMSVQGDRSPEWAIRRYLAAFGPATVADMQAWSGLTGLRDAVKRMRDELVSYWNEGDQELFDLPGAPITDDDGDAPVRFLPVFDNVLLSHKDRTRIISEERRKAIGTRNGLFQSTYLVDGFVAGAWKLFQEKDRAVLTLSPFEPHSRATIREMEEEGEALAGFVSGQSKCDIRIEES
jgi:hypothetical protein